VLGGFVVGRKKGGWGGGGGLSLNDPIPIGNGQNTDYQQQTVRDVPLEKHLPRKQPLDNALLNTTSINPCHDLILFEQITGEAV